MNRFSVLTRVLDTSLPSALICTTGGHDEELAVAAEKGPRQDPDMPAAWSQASGSQNLQNMSFCRL